MDLKGIKTRDLESELQRRKKAEIKPPVPLEDPNFSRLSRIVKECVTEIVEERLEDDGRQRQYVFEAAVEAVYGDSFWEWSQKMRSI